MLFQTFLNEIIKDNFVHPNDDVLVAVSGGADSVCLLHLMTRVREVLPLHLTCAHLNHGIRPEADRDETFVRKLCAAWNVDFVSKKADVKAIAKQRKISLELAGREVRYDFFNSLSKQIIMTAHTKNDSVETVLMHMIRGCGLSGLCGIPKIRGEIYRPLLSFSRQEIEAYLVSNGVSWVEDETNLDSVFTRNKIRNRIIPEILKINPSFITGFSETIDILKEENTYLDSLLQSYTFEKYEEGAVLLYIPEIKRMPQFLQKRAISKHCESANEVEDVLALLHKENGKRVSLCGGKTAEKEYEYISFCFPKNEPLLPVKLPHKGSILFGSYVISVGEKGLAIPKKEYIIRCRRNGDCFSPEGFPGHKKIKEFLNELKIPRRIRDELPIITFEDKIAAVADIRRDNSFVPSDKNVIHVKIQRRV